MIVGETDLRRRKLKTFTRRWGLLSLVVLVLVTGALAVSQQVPPSLPADHPLDPDVDAQTCFTCHDRPPPLESELADYCLQCHDLFFAHLKGRRPPHRVPGEWTVKVCSDCHSLHQGPTLRHPVSSPLEEADWCLTCHTPKGSWSGEEPVSQSCAQCHHLGLSPRHPQVEGDKAGTCFQCHSE